jgi:hypothetical protein
MATFPLQYRKHWSWAHYYGDPYEWIPSRVQLTPELHKWLSKNKVSHTINGTNAVLESITILDNSKAMLFKLTWL